MKLRHSATHPSLVLRLFLSISVLIAGAGFLVLAANAAGSFRQVIQSVLEGAPLAPGFLPFVVGVICIIYGLVGVIFRREDH
jgi:hypothetical protein